MKSQKIGEFTLVSPEKVERAMNGSITQNGQIIGGVTKEDGKYDDAALLAEYDRLGGLIRKGADTVKTGSFYDFRNRRPKAKPEVVLVYQINGKIVEVKDGEETPGIVKAAKILNEEEQKEREDFEAKAEADKEAESAGDVKKTVRRKK